MTNARKAPIPFEVFASFKRIDCDGVLTGQILEIEDTYVMLYAGKKGQEWQTGLATIRES